MDTEYIILEYVCPSLGCILASAMCAAPIADLRLALSLGALGDLNPVPWIFMSGTCLGWCSYAYYTQDPFVFFANFPGLLLSLWLNQGAIKLQYLEMQQQQKTRIRQNSTRTCNNDNDDALDMVIIHSNGNVDSPTRSTQQQQQHYISPETLIFVPQEVKFYRMILTWSFILIWVGWISPYLQQEMPSWNIFSVSSGTELIGLLTNANLVLFFGAPLSTLLQVWKLRQSSSIHRPTMYMNLLCATFWTGYGFARMDPIIILPNGIGIVLGIAQMVLCSIFPRGSSKEGRIPLSGEVSFDDDDNDHYQDDEDGIMMTNVGKNDNDGASQVGIDAELSDDDLELL